MKDLPIGSIFQSHQIPCCGHQTSPLLVQGFRVARALRWRIMGVNGWKQRYVDLDPSITFTSGATQVLASSGWVRNATNVVAVNFDIASDKKDSVPIPITLQIDDEVETMFIDGAIEVPWPVLEISRVVIDDATGDGDGVLDPGETADIDMYVQYWRFRYVFIGVVLTVEIRWCGRRRNGFKY